MLQLKAKRSSKHLEISYKLCQIYYIMRRFLSMYLESLVMNTRSETKKYDIIFACKKIIKTIKKTISTSLYVQDDSVLTTEFWADYSIFEYAKPEDVFRTNISEAIRQRHKKSESRYNKCRQIKIRNKVEKIIKLAVINETVIKLNENESITEPIDTFKTERIIKLNEYEFVTKRTNTFDNESITKLYKSIMEPTEAFENESITKPVIITEDEHITKPAFAHTEVLEQLTYAFFNGSKFVPPENESEYTSHTLPVINEMDAVKMSSKGMNVTDHKPVECLKDDEKLYNEVNSYDNKEQVMEQLFAHSFHIKTQIYEVYTLVKQPLPAIGDIPWNWLKEERWRLLTYSQYPHSAKKSAILLAAEGFAYCGSGRGSDDSVICYFCCVTKKDWLASDVISDIHRILSPDCSMVTGQNCTNIRMTVPERGIHLFSQLNSQIETKTVEDHKRGNESNTNEIETDDAQSSHSAECRHNLSGPLIESSRNVVSAQAPKPFQMANHTILPSNASNSSVSQEPASATVIHDQPVYTNVSSSSSVIPNRTQTTAVQQENIDITSSAETTPTSTTAGTTEYTSNGHQMTELNATLSSVAASQVNQNSQNTSASAAPSTHNTNQIPNLSQANSPPSATGNTSNANKATEKGPTYGELGIITERPKRFEYAVRATRYASFEPWPRDHHLTKEDLADAGFYYAGYGDCARCFYCGGGLRNWEDDDNVWVEHARWFPKCAYIRQTMGQSFVNVVQDLNKSFDKISYKMVTDKMGSSAASFHLDSKNMPLKRDPAVMTVLDMGYSEQDVIEAANYVKEHNNMLSSDKVFERLERTGKSRQSKGASADSRAEKHTYDTKQDEMVMKKLKEENSQLRQQTACKICMDKEVAVVFLPCGHFVSCTDCAAAMKDCPVCRKQVRGVVRAFIG